MRKLKWITTVLLCLILGTAMGLFVACTNAVTDDGECKVTFSLNYDGATEHIYGLVKEDGTVDRPTDPQRENYVFLGWYTESICITEFSFDTIITENIRVYAKWGLTVATVAFELGDGTTAETVSVDVGEKVERPADPSREDYAFVGWYADSAFNTEFNFNSTITENTTIYAKWNQLRASVTFYSYEGQSTVTKTDVGEKVAEPSSDPVREDYTFTGWYADAFCTKAYDFDNIITGDITVYAGWNLVVATVTLDYNYDGSQSSAVRVDVGDTLARPEDPERTGYDFVGWYNDPDGESQYDFTKEVTSLLTLYARWALATYTVTFHFNGSGEENQTTEVTYGEKIQMIEDPTWSGYEFLGWFTDAEATKFFDEDTIISQNTVLYAGWGLTGADGQYVFTYYLNYTGGGIYTTQLYKPNRKVTAPAVPTREGYYFAGWAKDADGVTMFNFNSEPAMGNTSLYAKWFNIYTFEAEYTYLKEMWWQGLSDNGVGTDCIISESAVKGVNGMDMGISNGYYVSKLYYKGATLEFDITSSKAVADAVITLRLSAEFFNMTLTSSTWQVLVNGVALNYSDIVIDNVVGQSDKDANGNSISGNVYKRPFTDYTLNVSLSLNEGENVIKLVTNNSVNRGGTYNADSPMVDCIYIYTDATLTWTKCYPEQVGQSLSSYAIAGAASLYQTDARKEKIYV